MPFKLTDTAIRAAKPKEKRYKLADGEGLYIEVAPTGGKWWRIKYRFGGKEKRLSLGVYPAVGLKEARSRAGEIKELLRRGIDPGEERKAAKAEAAAVEIARGQTFEAVAREWHSKKSPGWTPRYSRQILNRLEASIFPELGPHPIAELGAPDFLAMLHKVEARGCIEMAHRLAQLCGQVTRYARLAGIVQADAASGLTEALAPAVVRHYATITTPKEIGALLRAIDAYPGEVVTRYALKIIPYVFVRSEELRAAPWAEIDLEAATWLIPAERMKKRRPHAVPLAPQVVKLFRELREFTGNGPLVFPSTFSATRCLTDVGLLNALRRMGYGKEVMSIHGFRAMASTLLNEQGYRPDVIEAQLAHAEKNAVRAAYNHADYLPERRAMMEAWADYLDGLRESAGHSADKGQV
ncbi:MAG: integrase arm-type DNA-binding domain-containing protein [Desulfovibrio sp.]|nr:integrase arm-type DNA-binding domain-containing protein [Desulfovibrio sp.]